ncbi:MAG: hypothetical protein ACRERX_15650 [Pseudomonas sp.]
MKVSITANDLDDALAAVNRLAGDLPGRAVADALNHSAFQARIALHAEMADVFKTPTPWTLKSVQVFEAKKTKLEAALWINDYPVSKDLAPDRWLRAQVFGGPRTDKGLEKLLRGKGILPAGRFVVPGAGARLDRYGNLSPGHISQIKSGLGIADRAGYTGNASKNKRSEDKGHAKAFFVIRRGKTPIGIAERRGEDKVVVVLAFVRQPFYRRRLDFHGVIGRVAGEQLETNVDIAITKALNGTLGKGYKRPRG